MGARDYRLGTSYAIATALLMSFQAPFSAFAARRLGSLDFMAFTQLALLFSIPLLILQADSRRDFVAIMFRVRNWPKLAVIFLVGVAGLKLYNIGLSSTHPIITAAVLNLSPFWAALVAAIVSKRSVSLPSFGFLACFFVAFFGAMAIAWSQIDVDSKVLARDVLESFLHSKWIYALPMPAFFALSGTLVYRWFSEFDETAAIAANFVVSSLFLIPLAAFTTGFGQPLHSTQPHDGGGSAVAVGYLGWIRCRARLLSNGFDGDRRRQRLRHDVLPLDTGALLADLLHAVVVDTRFAIRSQRDVFCRLGARDDLAPHVVVSVPAEERTQRFALWSQSQRR